MTGRLRVARQDPAGLTTKHKDHKTSCLLNPPRCAASPAIDLHASVLAGHQLSTTCLASDRARAHRQADDGILGSQSPSTEVRKNDIHMAALWMPLTQLSDRNTTLPHPEANLSPNATLGEEDISPERALMRARNSFLKEQTSRPNNAEGFMDGIKSFERMARAVRGDVSKKPSDNGATWANTTATPTTDSDSVMSTSSNGSGPRRLETPFVNRAQPLFPPDSPDSKKSTKSTGKRAWFARNILGRSP